MVGLDETPWSALVAAIEQVEAIRNGTVTAKAAQENGDDVLWCVNSDDPRCSQRDPAQDAPSFSQISSSSSGVLVKLPSVRSWAGVRVAWVDEVGHASAGVRDRVERPPRG